MTQVFDREQAVRAADQAIEAGAVRVDPVWRAAALDAALTVIARGRPFTTDAVWEELQRRYPAIESRAQDGRALGALLRHLRAARRIWPTDRYLPSARVRCHGRPVRVWECR